MNEEETNLTPEEVEMIKHAVGGEITTSEDKQSLFSFFNKVIIKKDNTKIGNVTKDELGITRHTIRGYNVIANYFDMNNLPDCAKYFREKGNQVLGTGLSKDGFFVQLPTISIKNIGVGKKNTGGKSSWFKKNIEE